LETLFTKADSTGSGSIDADEFAPFVRDRLKIRTMTDDQVDRLFQALDVDGGGSIDLDEMRQFQILQKMRREFREAEQKRRRDKALERKSSTRADARASLVGDSASVAIFAKLAEDEKRKNGGGGLGGAFAAFASTTTPQPHSSAPADTGNSFMLTNTGATEEGDAAARQEKAAAVKVQQHPRLPGFGVGKYEVPLVDLQVRATVGPQLLALNFPPSTSRPQLFAPLNCLPSAVHPQLFCPQLFALTD
jgi:hypothetical protein